MESTGAAVAVSTAFVSGSPLALITSAAEILPCNSSTIFSAVFLPKPDDAADALAVALCHAYTSRFGELFSVGNMTRTKGKNANAGAIDLIAEAERRRAARIQAQKNKNKEQGK